MDNTMDVYMKDLRDKTDVVSVILDNNDLLNTFADALEIKTPDDIDEIETKISAVKLQKLRCYLWSTVKNILSFVLRKTEVLVVLVEYHLKNLTKE